MFVGKSHPRSTTLFVVKVSHLLHQPTVLNGGQVQLPPIGHAGVGAKEVASDQPLVLIADTKFTSVAPISKARACLVTADEEFMGIWTVG